MTNKFKKYLESKLNFDLIDDIKSDIKNIHIDMIDDLYVLYFNNISPTILKNEIDTYNICIFDKSLDLFYIDKKPLFLHKNSINNIIKNINDCNIYENIGDIIYNVKYNDKTYIVYKYNTIYKIYNIENVYFKNLFINYINNNDDDNNYVKKMSLINVKYNKILYYKNNDVYEDILNYKEKKVHFSCIDELIFDLEKISNIFETKKKISSNGYIIEYDNNDYIINYNIYQKIIDIMPKYSNINKCYIELYKNDNLNFMISFMTIYCHDILNRVNLSIKNISKELLNIYHFTRKQQNKDLNDILTNTYRLLIDDLHKIFLYSKKYDETYNNEKDFIDKISLNNDIVYKYIKTINDDLLIKLYIDRDIVLEKIKNININFNEFNNTPSHYKIIFIDCIYTKTMSALLNL
jgi:hypothetical protein